MTPAELEERARDNWPHAEPFALVGTRCAICGYDYAEDLEVVDLEVAALERARLEELHRGTPWPPGNGDPGSVLE
jgi:hypothetical protein